MQSWPEGQLGAAASEGRPSPLESETAKEYGSEVLGGVPVTQAARRTRRGELESGGAEMSACMFLSHRANDAVKVSEPGTISLQTQKCFNSKKQTYHFKQSNISLQASAI